MLSRVVFQEIIETMAKFKWFMFIGLSFTYPLQAYTILCRGPMEFAPGEGRILSVGQEPDRRERTVDEDTTK